MAKAVIAITVAKGNENALITMTFFSNSEPLNKSIASQSAIINWITIIIMLKISPSSNPDLIRCFISSISFSLSRRLTKRITPLWSPAILMVSPILVMALPKEKIPRYSTPTKRARTAVNIYLMASPKPIPINEMVASLAILPEWFGVFLNNI